MDRGEKMTNTIAVEQDPDFARFRAAGRLEALFEVLAMLDKLIDGAEGTYQANKGKDRGAELVAFGTLSGLRGASYRVARMAADGGGA
jgi:hypothetical protein